MIKRLLKICIAHLWLIALWPVQAMADSTTCSTGVLVDSSCANDPNYNFANYVGDFMKKNFPFILLIALVMIIFSGVQYMTSGFTPDAQKQAKNRIIGILTGVVFYLLIDLILAQISPSLQQIKPTG